MTNRISKYIDDDEVKLLEGALLGLDKCIEIVKKGFKISDYKWASKDEAKYIIAKMLVEFKIDIKDRVKEIKNEGKDL